MQSPRSDFEEFFLSVVMYCLSCSVRIQFENLNANVNFLLWASSSCPRIPNGWKKIMLGMGWFLVLQGSFSVCSFYIQESLQIVLAFLEQGWVGSLPLGTVAFTIVSKNYFCGSVFALSL